MEQIDGCTVRHTDADHHNGEGIPTITTITVQIRDLGEMLKHWHDRYAAS